MSVCPHCEREFTPSNRRQRYCSENCRKRFCDEAHRARCVDCGARLTAGSGWLKRTYERCRSCEIGRVNARRRERRETIQRMWADGAHAREIAAALGSTANAISVEIHSMRRDGWDLPIRRQDLVGGGTA